MNDQHPNKQEEIAGLLCGSTLLSKFISATASAAFICLSYSDESFEIPNLSLHGRRNLLGQDSPRMSMQTTKGELSVLSILLKQEAEHKQIGAIQACQRGAHWERALSLLMGMSAALMRPDFGSFRATIRMCKGNGHWQHVLSLLKKMQSVDITPDVSLFYAAMKSCHKNDQPERAVSLINQMRVAGVRPDLKSFNLALWVCAENGLWKRAVDLLEDMSAEGLTPELHQFRVAMVACKRGSSWKKALSLLEKMEAADVKPDVEIFNGAISACEKNKKGCFSLSVLNRMDRAEISPNTASYSLAISACQRSGEQANVLSVLKRMRKRGVTPDVVGFNAEIWACEDSGQWERALQLLDEMCAVHVRPDLFTFNAAMSICHKSGQWERASSLLDEMHVGPGNFKMPRLQKVSQLTDEGLDSIFTEIKKMNTFRWFNCHFKLDFKVAGDQRMQLNPPYEFLQPLVSAMSELAEKLLGADQQLAILQLILNFFEDGNNTVRAHRHRCRQICVSLGASREVLVDGKRLIMHHGDALYLKGEVHSVPAAEQVDEPRISVCLFFGTSEEYTSGTISVQPDQKNSDSGSLWWVHPPNQVNTTHSPELASEEERHAGDVCTRLNGSSNEN
mmetsp:Transcript_44675/g.83288  ORF Transcript_44675/g.83288 Transcript_44675/m.83288 type:complete len:620 (+) Transcript_44675:164-2023(+)